MTKKTIDAKQMPGQSGHLPVEANPRTPGGLDFSEADTAAAASLGIVLTGSLEDRIQRAVFSFNHASRLAVEAGYLLLSVKAEVAHGQFEEGVESLGLTRQRASELMRMAKFATSLPDDRRAEMLMLPKSKVLAIAAADQSVLEDLLQNDDPDKDVANLSVRDLRTRIRELEAQVTDTAVERDTVIAERDGLAKQLRRRRADEAEGDGGVPLVVADLRAEAAELVKKAELSLASLHPLGVDIVQLASHDEAHVWISPTLRLALSGLVALRVQVDGLIEQYAEALGDDVRKLQSAPDGLSFLDDDEIKAVAEEWSRLVALHQHEQALRAHEREQAHPKGKGRPPAPPKPPKAVKAAKAGAA
jgi:hypothetical protein